MGHMQVCWGVGQALSHHRLAPHYGQEPDHSHLQDNVHWKWWLVLWADGLLCLRAEDGIHFRNVLVAPPLSLLAHAFAHPCPSLSPLSFLPLISLLLSSLLSFSPPPPPLLSSLSYLTTSWRLFLKSPSTFSEGNPMATMLGLMTGSNESQGKET